MLGGTLARACKLTCGNYVASLFAILAVVVAIFSKVCRRERLFSRPQPHPFKGRPFVALQDAIGSSYAEREACVSPYEVAEGQLDITDDVYVSDEHTVS